VVPRLASIPTRDIAGPHSPSPRPVAPQSGLSRPLVVTSAALFLPSAAGYEVYCPSSAAATGSVWPFVLDGDAAATSGRTCGWLRVVPAAVDAGRPPLLTVATGRDASECGPDAAPSLTTATWTTVAWGADTGASLAPPSVVGGGGGAAPSTRDGAVANGSVPWRRGGRDGDVEALPLLGRAGGGGGVGDRTAVLRASELGNGAAAAGPTGAFLTLALAAVLLKLLAG